MCNDDISNENSKINGLGYLTLVPNPICVPNLKLLA